jgi:hypothetical protein
MNIITRAKYDELVVAQPQSELWRLNAADRWEYHEAAAKVVETIALNCRDMRVLEIGSHGVQIVEGSTTMDVINDVWPITSPPDIVHDARIEPWPIADKQYDICIALRVWQHLGNQQFAALFEAARVARNIVIGVPWSYYGGTGVDIAKMYDWSLAVDARLEHIGSFYKTWTAVYWLQSVW